MMMVVTTNSFIAHKATYMVLSIWYLSDTMCFCGGWFGQLDHCDAVIYIHVYVYIDIYVYMYIDIYVYMHKYK